MLVALVLSVLAMTVIVGVRYLAVTLSGEAFRATSQIAPLTAEQPDQPAKAELASGLGLK